MEPDDYVLPERPFRRPTALYPPGTYSVGGTRVNLANGLYLVSALFMKIILNQVALPFQVGDNVFINQPLYYWSENLTKMVPYFSGVIKEIEICINPASRLIRNKAPQTTLLIDRIRYAIWPHSQFNPFGQVQIFDRILSGSQLFSTEQALLLSAEGAAQSLV